MNGRGKVALATGAGSGLGLATSRKPVGAGARLVCLDIGEERLRAAIADLGRRRHQYHEAVLEADIPYPVGVDRGTRGR